VGGLGKKEKNWTKRGGVNDGKAVRQEWFGDRRGITSMRKRGEGGDSGREGSLSGRGRFRGFKKKGFLLGGGGGQVAGVEGRSLNLTAPGGGVRSVDQGRRRRGGNKVEKGIGRVITENQESLESTIGKSPSRRERGEKPFDVREQ